jgi:gliding motility-associated-like protein
MYVFFRPVLRIFICLLLCCPAVPISTHAQVQSSGYVQVIPTGYETDSIYVFCQERGNLSASYAEVPGNLTFTWSVYDPAIPGFGLPVRTDQAETSQFADLESGGYQVRISDGSSLDTLFRAWVFVNRPSASIEVRRHDCIVLDLLGTIDKEIFTYFNPLTNAEVVLPADYSFSWSGDPFVPISQSRLDPRIIPPSVKTDFTLMAGYYSCIAEYTISEEPLATTAGFVIDRQEGEAPLEVRFDAAISLNASEYEWYFDYHPGEPVTGPPDDLSPAPSYIYYIPGEYYVTLRTVTGLCDDIFTHPEPVRVYPSELEIPNVFTPDGDGYNDVFMVRAVSMQAFHAVVYNRNGRKMHEWRDPSEGWDGRVDGSPATPGTYFYVITGLGWDDRKYEFTGPLYLYRGR